MLKLPGALGIVPNVRAPAAMPPFLVTLVVCQLLANQNPLQIAVPPFLVTALILSSRQNQNPPRPPAPARAADRHAAKARA